MQFITRLIISAFALVLIAYILPGITIDGLYPAFIAALILGILNAVVRPVLVILTLPITVVTLGIFIFVINAALFLFVASFVDGFHVDGFLPAFVGSFLVSVVSSIAHKVL
jgi:putative membrane protein